MNLITQQVGARIYADGIRHSLELPYAQFEVLRSGETLGMLQKVRTDVKKLINISVNLLFHHPDRRDFRDVLRRRSALVNRARLPAHHSVAGQVEFPCSATRSKRCRQIIVETTTALAGSTTESLRNIELVKSLGLAQQEIARLNSTTAEDSETGIEKSPLSAQPQLHPGHFRQHAADLHPLSDALPDLHPAHHRRPVLLALHLLVLHLRTPPGVGKRSEHIPRNRSISTELREKFWPWRPEPRPARSRCRVRATRDAGLRRRRLPAPVRQPAGPRTGSLSRFQEGRRSRLSDRQARARQRWSSCWWVCTGRGPAIFSTTRRGKTRSRSKGSAKKIGFVTQDAQLLLRLHT